MNVQPGKRKARVKLNRSHIFKMYYFYLFYLFVLLSYMHVDSEETEYSNFYFRKNKIHDTGHQKTKSTSISYIKRINGFIDKVV